MKKQYSATIGIPDHLKAIDSEKPRDVLVEAHDAYEAHKLVYFKTKGNEEVLSITQLIEGKPHGTVYDIVNGFRPTT